MDINDKAVDNLAQWLNQVGGVAMLSYSPLINRTGKVLTLAAFVLFAYVKLPGNQRAIVDEATIEAICTMNGVPITPFDARQVFLFLQNKRAVGRDNRVAYSVRHAIASMA
jgi:hypothetical protein